MPFCALCWLQQHSAAPAGQKTRQNNPAPHYPMQFLPPADRPTQNLNVKEGEKVARALRDFMGTIANVGRFNEIMHEA